MSVQSEIDRIAGAKSDISTAITNKGVAVPSGTKLDGMAALIRSIASGGSTLELETGEITSNKSASAPFLYDYTFDLSTITNLKSRVMVALIDTNWTTQKQSVVAILVKNGGKYSIFAGGAFEELMSIGFYPNTSIIKVNEAILYNDTSENPTYYAI